MPSLDVADNSDLNPLALSFATIALGISKSDKFPDP